MNCSGCAAPVVSAKCEYCGTGNYPDIIILPIDLYKRLILDMMCCSRFGIPNVDGGVVFTTSNGRFVKIKPDQEW